MNRRRARIFLVGIPLLIAIGIGVIVLSSNPIYQLEVHDHTDETVSHPPVEAPPPVWWNRMADGYHAARRDGRPILVRVGTASCPWCRKLEHELTGSLLAAELTRWTLVAVTASEVDRTERSLAVGAVPALRILSPSGRVVASRDGYLSAEPLLGWLQEHYIAAAGSPPEKLTTDEPPTNTTIDAIVAELGQRDPVLREAAIRRLLPHPDRSAADVVVAFTRGTLQSRLAALELLRGWRAPVEGLDPWQTETLTADRLRSLREWANGPHTAATGVALTAADRAAIDADLARLPTAPEGEAMAIRERLVRFGPTLLLPVNAALKAAETDRARERLTALRYRLAARDGLALRWPNGFDRLAATDVTTRREAAEELARYVTPDDEALLLELFGSPDPLVRELSLRALHTASGREAAGALARLLDDPEPNVKAAVLKQLAESPSPKLLDRLARFAAEEVDVDLVVHAVRAIRAIHDNEVVIRLTDMARHPSWRVRAESVEGIGEKLKSSDESLAPVRERGFAAVEAALADEDGFVVGRAIEVYKKASQAPPVEPLMKAAAAHPELAAEVAKLLGQQSTLQQGSLPHLRTLAKHTNAAVRAAAVEAIVDGATDESADDLQTALRDGDSVVRTAAAAAMFEQLEMDRNGMVYQLRDERVNSRRSSDPDADPDADPVLVRLRSKSDFPPAGYDKLVSELETILAADAPDERLQAALVLTALGRDSIAVPVLKAVAAASEHRAGQAAIALAWLPWPQRVDLFHSLTAASRRGEPLVEVVRGFGRSPDARAVGKLWDLAAADEISPDVADAIADAIASLPEALHPQRFNEQPLTREIVAAARDKLGSGSELRRLTALLVLADTDSKAGITAALELYRNPTTPALLRDDAFRIGAALRPRDATTPIAIAALAQPAPIVRQSAVEFLCFGTDPMNTLRNGEASVNRYVHTRFVNNPLSEFIPWPRPGLDRERLRALLADPDPSTVGGAGYLLTLLRDPVGLPPLLAHWRDRARDSWPWTRLVAEAIASLDDDQRVPVLEEIYFENARNSDGTLDTYHCRDLYWTIRPMTGPNALRLRKRIRDDVGMNALNGG